MQTDLSCEEAGEVRNVRDFCGIPATDIKLFRQANDGAIGLNGQQIEHSVVTRICGGDRFDLPNAGRKRNLAEVSRPLIAERREDVGRRR